MITVAAGKVLENNFSFGVGRLENNIQDFGLVSLCEIDVGLSFIHMCVCFRWERH